MENRGKDSISPVGLAMGILKTLSIKFLPIVWLDDPPKTLV